MSRWMVSVGPMEIKQKFVHRTRKTSPAGPKGKKFRPGGRIDAQEVLDSDLVFLVFVGDFVSDPPDLTAVAFSEDFAASPLLPAPDSDFIAAFRSLEG